MGKFVLGVIVTLVVLAAIAYFYPTMGYVDFRADQKPSAMETKYAMSAVDASAEHHAPEGKNPVAASDANLLEGARQYETTCAGCHGDPKVPQSQIGDAFYPPAPQFMKDAPDMPQNQNFFIIKHGIRWTGMPAWGSLLSDEQIWKLAAFLGHMEKLPPGVDQQWRAMAQHPPAP